MRMIAATALAVATLAGCASHARMDGRLEPTAHGYRYVVPDYAGDEQDRMAWLAEALAGSGLCPDGFTVVSRERIPIPVASYALRQTGIVHYGVHCNG